MLTPADIGALAGAAHPDPFAVLGMHEHECRLWVRAVMPQRAEKIFAALADARGGTLQEARFGRRMVGRGPRWQAIEQLFRIQCARLGLQVRIERKVPVPRPRQLGLFGGQ